MKYVLHNRERAVGLLQVPEMAPIPWTNPTDDPSTGATDDSVFTSNMWSHGPVYMQSSAGGVGSSGEIGGHYLTRMNTDAGRNMVEQMFIVNYDATAGSSLTNPQLGFAVRGSGAAGAETCYFGTLRLGSNILEIYKRAAGTDTLLASRAYTFTAGYDYYLKFRASGTTNTLLQLTCWRGDEEMPVDSAPTLYWEGTKSIVPEIGPNPTSMTRNLAAYFGDWEGLLKLVPAHCARFTGARFVQNLLTYPQAFDNAVWNKLAGMTCTANAGIIAPDGTATADRMSATAAGYLTYTAYALTVGRAYTLSFYVAPVASAINFGFGTLTAGDLYSQAVYVAVVPGAFQRISITFTALAGEYLFIQNNSGAIAWDVWGAQLDDVTGQSNRNPSPHVSVGVLAFPYHGAGPDGCKFFDTPNGNTVSSVVNLKTYSNAFSTSAGWSNDLTSLQQNAAAPDGTLTAWTLTDSNAGSYLALVANQIAVPNDSGTYCVAIRVKKTSGGTSPTFGVNVGLSGGTTVVNVNPRLNTDNGAVGGPSTAWSIAGDYWLFSALITNNGTGNTALNFSVYPATGPNGGAGVGVDSPTAVGSAVVAWVQPEKTLGPSTYVETVALPSQANVVTEAVGVGPVRWLTLPGIAGNYAETLATTANRVTGDIDLRRRVAMVSWTPPVRSAILSRQDVSNESCGVFSVLSSGVLEFYFAFTGLSPAQELRESTVATGFAAGTMHWVRVTRVAATGVIRFYTSEDGVVWVQLGAAVASTAGTIYNDTSPWRIGGLTPGGATYVTNSRDYYAEVRNGIDGPIVAKFDPSTDHSGSYGLRTNGLNGYASVQYYAALPYTGAEMTVEGRFQINSNEAGGGVNNAILSRPWNGGGQYNWQLMYGEGGADTALVHLHGGASAWQSSSFAFTRGVPHHVAVVLKSDKSVLVYVDSVLTLNTTHTITSWAPSGGDAFLPLLVGTLYPYSGGWAGDTSLSTQLDMADNIRVWTVARTQAQIDANKALHIAADTGLQLSLKVTGLDGRDKIVDTSGNNRHAQLFNGAQIAPYPYFDSSTGERWSVASTFQHGAQIKEAFTPATLRKYRKEKAAENKLLRSSEFDNVAWTKTPIESAVTPNATKAPDGTLTADLFADATTANSQRSILQSRAVAATADPYTTTFYAKNAGWPILRVFLSADAYAAYTYARFHLDTGRVDSVTQLGHTGGKATITPLPDGWYVCTISATKDAVTTTMMLNPFLNDSAGYVGVVGQGVYLWEAQIEAGLTATSPINTTTAAVTRPEDQLVWPISVHSDTAGTAYAEYEADNWVLPANNAIIGDGAGIANGWPLTASQDIGAAVYDQTILCQGPAGAPVGVMRGASVWGAGTMQAFKAGVAGTATAYDGSFSQASVGIGFSAGATFSFQGHIGNVKICSPTALGYTDSASPITAAGYAGPIWHLAGAHSRGVRRLGFYSTGTSGDAAPMPVSFRKMADWLMNDSVGNRIAIMDMHCKGSSDGSAAGTGYSNAIASVATAEFVSGPSDFRLYPPTPSALIGSNQTSDDILLDVPNFTARSNDSLLGRASLSYGDAIIANENGERDDWLRYSWDGWAVELSIGGRGWPRWDFFRVLTTTIADIYAPSPGRIGFRLRDSAIKLDRRLQGNLVGGTGPNAGRYTPVTGGKAFNVPLVLYDAATLRYVGNDDGLTTAISTLLPYITDIRNKGSSLTKVGTVTAVNSGTDTITVVAHGGRIGSMAMFTAGTPPAGLSLNQFYKLNTVPSADTFTLEANGSLVNITDTTTGATILIQNWVLSHAAPNTQYYVELVASPGGDASLTADLAGHLATAYGTPVVTTDNVQAVINYIAQVCFGTLFGGSAAGIQTYGAGKVANLPTTVLGFHSVDEINGLEAMEQVVSAVGASYAINSMGRLYAAVLTLPAATFDFELFEADLDYDSFKPERMIYPQPVQQLGYKKNYTVQESGLVTSLSVADSEAYRAEYLYTTLASTTGVDASAGLDVAANHLLNVAPENRPTVLYAQADADAEGTRIAVMRSKMLIVFTMVVRAYQIFIQLGDRVKVTHPRYGFETGEIGVVIGRAQNFLNNGVTLQVLFRVAGRWPTVAAGGMFVQVDDFYKVTAP